MAVIGSELLFLLEFQVNCSFDLILAEHAATVTAMEMIRHNQDTVEEEARQQLAVQVL